MTYSLMKRRNSCGITGHKAARDITDFRERRYTMKGKAELHCNTEMTKMHGKEKVKDFRKVRKPRGLTVEENDNEIRLILDGKKVEEENMQN